MKVPNKLLIIGAVAVAFVALSFLGGASAQPSQSVRSQSDGTRAMVEFLKRLATDIESRPQENAFGNPKRVDALRLMLATALDEAKQLQIQLTLSEELLRAGETQESIQQLTALSERLSQKHGGGASALGAQVTSLFGLAYLRLGEQDNCIQSHNIESCILPISPDGVHKTQRGSRMAIDKFQFILAFDPGNLTARWLLNIAYMTVGEYPSKVPEDYLIPPDTFDSDMDIKRFVDVAPALKISNSGLAGGALMDDFDGDGYLDIIVSSSGLTDQLRYYHNDGNGRFKERTQEAGLTGITGGLNLLHADYDNDGNLDVLVLRGGWMKRAGRLPKSLLRNIGKGRFEDVTAKAGLMGLHPTQTASWGDYNGDGLLDLFVGYESEPDDKHPCELFHNNGNGTFTEVASKVGVANVAYVKAAVWGDYNNDGRPDLYLSRLGASNVLYRNDGPVKGAQPSDGAAWSFSDVTLQARVEQPRDSFPTWFWDYDNDGWLDIFVSGWRAPNSVADVAADYLDLPHEGETPRLYRNNHDGTFSNVTTSVKLSRLLVGMGANYGDLDNDGWPDFYMGTGAPDLAMLIPNRMFRNAAGKFFQDVTTSSGTGHLQKGHGVAFGDIDNDGDQDIYTTIGGAYSGDVYWNALFLNPGHGNRWLTLKLIGGKANRNAIGARIKVTVSTPKGVREIHAIGSSGGSFGGSSLQQEIGLGDATVIRQVEIIWPGSGTRQVIQSPKMDQALEVHEGSDKAVKISLETLRFPIDAKASHQHAAHP